MQQFELEELLFILLHCYSAYRTSCLILVSNNNNYYDVNSDCVSFSFSSPCSSFYCKQNKETFSKLPWKLMKTWLVYTLYAVHLLAVLVLFNDKQV